MSYDVVIDTVSCLPYLRHLVFVPSSSRIRPVPISYRIPDDIATQSITGDTGYQLASPHPSPRPISSPYLLPTPLPAAPCRPTGRIETRRHPTRYSLATCLACLPSSHRSISSAHLIARCLLALSAALRRHPPSSPCGSSISSAPFHLIGSSTVPSCFPPGVPPRLAQSHRLISSFVACLSRPSHSSHQSHRLIARILSPRHIG